MTNTSIYMMLDIVTSSTKIRQDQNKIVGISEIFSEHVKHI